MEGEKVGFVTEGEKKEIMSLYERKLALRELSLTLDSPRLSTEEKETLSKKMEEAFGEISVQYDKWWAEKGEKYRWKSIENGSWNINFQTNEIFLTAECTCIK